MLDICLPTAKHMLVFLYCGQFTNKTNALYLDDRKIIRFVRIRCLFYACSYVHLMLRDIKYILKQYNTETDICLIGLSF